MNAASSAPTKKARQRRVWAIERRDGEEVARFDSRHRAEACARDLAVAMRRRYRVVSYAERA